MHLIVFVCCLPETLTCVRAHSPIWEIPDLPAQSHKGRPIGAYIMVVWNSPFARRTLSRQRWTTGKGQKATALQHVVRTSHRSAPEWLLDNFRSALSRRICVLRTRPSFSLTIYSPTGFLLARWPGTATCFASCKICKSVRAVQYRYPFNIFRCTAIFSLLNISGCGHGRFIEEPIIMCYVLTMQQHDSTWSRLCIRLCLTETRHSLIRYHKTLYTIYFLS
jgi:hypothetical protein